MGSGRFRDSLEYLVDLLFQRRGIERLDDVAVHPGLRRFDDLLALRFGGHHQHRRLADARITADVAQQLDAGHAGHVPVGDDEVETAGLQQWPRRLAVIGFGDIRVTEVAEQRSEERRVGKEGVSTCRSGWSPYN